MFLSRLLIVLVLFFVSSSSLYGLRTVRKNGHIIFYNERDLKVKVYYVHNNKILYISRYYYNSKHFCVKKETWKSNTLISVLLFTYYQGDNHLKTKQYYYKNKLIYEVRYDLNGDIIERRFINKDSKDLKRANIKDKKKEKKLKRSNNKEPKEVKNLGK